MKKENRFLGSIFGLAIGDALGAPVEFKSKGNFTHVKSFRAGGEFNLRAGEWTDDTSMALAMADSIVTKLTMDQQDQLTRYWAWYQFGRYSVNGRCFDIGINTRESLERWKRTGKPSPGIDRSTSGNGSLMRLAPAVLAFSNTRQTATAAAILSSTTTHASDVVLDCVEIMTAALMDALDGRVETIVGPMSYRTAEGCDVGMCGMGSMTEMAINPSGYAPESLWCALHSIRSTNTFKDAVLKAVNYGGDADTIGAITGQIAGALYGFDGIPEVWRRKVAQPDMLSKVAHSLYGVRNKVSL